MTDIPLVGSLSADERETVVAYNDNGLPVKVWSTIRRDITAMKKNPVFTLLREGHYGSTAWAEFEVPASEFAIGKAARRRRNLSAEQRQAISERMRNLHTNMEDDIPDDTDDF